ncbi:hypothetical protein A1O1_03980 [Capronia coronata CBS 617.96]|uniref:Zinc finger RING-type eukaryotic domain-containing protein n=1 Tax=Capronia coronata CBS 617.96 TaxID=1182541 RepID=W9YMJ7_9EURO|nr:uncharacterized protein A1O1_03980 [Capronia coronata CBS 617.96]EXJ90875.1 hypothetical protein A1O1_03980 [Capronia coronata CBS 617.96]
MASFFTSHERAVLRSNWGSQSTRLTRESFLPFGYCRLCLGPAQNPVACTDGNGDGKGKGKVAKVHLFCRECALNDLMAQRKEIKRLERDAELHEREEREAAAQEEEERRRRDLEGFERSEMGFDDSYDPSTSASTSGRPGAKRKREAEEMHGHAASDTNSNGHDQKKPKSSESSFWVPGSDSLAAATKGSKSSQKLKFHPICPASTPETKHNYSLKSLVTVNFTESDAEAGSRTNRDGNLNEPVRICPSCKKALTNTSRPMLGTAEGCGHVICGACADLFLSGSEGQGATATTAGGNNPRTKAATVEITPNGTTENMNDGSQSRVRPQINCFVCEADLSGSTAATSEEKQEDQGSKKDKDKKDKHRSKDKNSGGRLVEISCEGTGFAGVGANVTKRDGVAFQC